MQAFETPRPDRAVGLHFCSTLAEAISVIASSPCQIAIAEEPFNPHPTASDAACLRFHLSGGLEGNVYLVLRKSEIVTLGISNLTAVSGDEARLAALGDCLQPVCGLLISALSQYGQVKVTVEPKAGAALPTETVLELVLTSTEKDVRLAMHLFFDPALIGTLRGAAATALSYPSVADSSAAANLDLVMDVELNVTLRFGQRQLPLREVLDLTSGSVVELDRQVDEPVELILDGRVVARGEAVIIDGNYGMRITQVLHHMVP